MNPPGLLLLAAVIAAASQSAFRQFHRIWFVDTEIPIYDFIANHLRVHGRLPAAETLREHGMTLPRAPETLEYYRDRTRKRAMFMQFQSVYPEIAQVITSRDMDRLPLLLRQAQSRISAVNPSSDITSLTEQGSRIIEAYDVAQRTFRLLGVSLGWDCLDEITEGGQGGDVIVLAGRPNVGKTYGLLWMVRRAWRSGAKILFASMEMPPEQIARRIVGIQTGLNPSLIRRGRLSTWGRNSMLQEVQAFDDMAPFQIISGNFRKRVSDIDRAAQEFEPDLIVVDGGYLLTPDGAKSKGNGRREQISDVIEELKMVAADRNKPLLTSVQLNRQVKKRQRAGELELSHIAETDVIAQIASVVIGMEHSYHPTEGRRRLSLLKNREGGLINWETNFSFAPVDLSYIRMIDDEVIDDDGENGEDVEVARRQLAHMI